jgi:nitrogen fixation/metabolism regulation signal transduction histidine kinase
MAALKNPRRTRHRLPFETRIMLGGLGVALPSAVALAIALLSREQSWQDIMLIVVGVLVPTLLLALRLRANVAFPLYTVSNLLEALREGDFSLRGSRARRGDAIGEVVWEVNALSQTLREQRLRVEETVALLSKVLQGIDLAILTFDADRRLRLINPAAERLLGLAHGAGLGVVSSELGVDDCLAVAEAATLRRAFPGGSGPFEVRRAQFREGGRPHDLLVISDVSRALREEERAAWQRLIRVLGHELNNSLAPIKSMAATLSGLIAREPLPSDWRDDARAGLDVIGDRAAALNRFMLGYTTLARMPPPTRRRTAIAELVARVAKLEHRVPVRVTAGEELSLDVDADQVEQALINLLRNAAEAAGPLGGAVDLRWRREGEVLAIEVIDEGPGLAASENLFVPFFTTKPGGSGIGLVLARQVAEAHGGALSLGNRSDRTGCIAKLTLRLVA